MKFYIAGIMFFLMLVTMNCASQQKQIVREVIIDPNNPFQCEGYRESINSAYILPYPEGNSYILYQGNCERYSHKGTARYAYDFAMPINSEITAARSGTVIRIESSWPDHRRSGKRKYRRTGNNAGNIVEILHDDGSVGAYLHLMQNGIQVKTGQRVKQGEVIARSGASGFVTGSHLHFEVRRSRTDRQTIPVTFRNSSPSEKYNLKTKKTYTALKLVPEKKQKMTILPLK